MEPGWVNVFVKTLSMLCFLKTFIIQGTAQILKSGFRLLPNPSLAGDQVTWGRAHSSGSRTGQLGLVCVVLFCNHSPRWKHLEKYHDWAGGIKDWSERGLLLTSRNWHRAQNEIIQRGMNPVGCLPGPRVLVSLHQQGEGKYFSEVEEGYILCVCVRCVPTACAQTRAKWLRSVTYVWGVFFWRWRRAIKTSKKYKSQLKKHFGP